MYSDIRATTVAVIGSGIAGCLSALLLAEQGRQVHLIEQGPDILRGTSFSAVQVHLGGLYSASPATAIECLRSAVRFKKHLPEGVTRQCTWFLVAESSELSGDNFLQFYQSLLDEYAQMPACDQVFGRPQDFYRVLDRSEYSFVRGIESGLASQEPLLDVMALRHVLITRLHRLGVRISTSTEVKGVTPVSGGFTLSVSGRPGRQKWSYGQVINAGGYMSRLLDHQLDDRTEYNLDLKTWSIVRTRNAGPMPPFYVIRGEYMHYSPINDQLASLIVPSNIGSYLDTIQFDARSPKLPHSWRKILSSGKVPGERAQQRAVIACANELVPDVKFEPIALIPGVAVSYSPVLDERQHRGVNKVMDGWHTIVPTKFTNALELAEEAVNGVLAYEYA
jgi:glycine/D-amino acid oxidase-like deaminating enzyme